MQPLSKKKKLNPTCERLISGFRAYIKANVTTTESDGLVTGSMSTWSSFIIAKAVPRFNRR